MLAARRGLIGATAPHECRLNVDVRLVGRGDTNALCRRADKGSMVAQRSHTRWRTSLASSAARDATCDELYGGKTRLVILSYIVSPSFVSNGPVCRRREPLNMIVLSIGVNLTRQAR